MSRFDVDLSRVSRSHYITGKAAINFYWPDATTGGWHRTAYWDKEAGQVKVSLAGIHFPDTTAYLDDAGIVDAGPELRRRGWKVEREIFIADHFRATADMVIAWSSSTAPRCNVELNDWFSEDQDFCRIVELLTAVTARLDSLPRQRLDGWLEDQLRLSMCPRTPGTL